MREDPFTIFERWAEKIDKIEWHYKDLCGRYLTAETLSVAFIVFNKATRKKRNAEYLNIRYYRGY